MKQTDNNSNNSNTQNTSDINKLAIVVKIEAFPIPIKDICIQAKYCDGFLKKRASVFAAQTRHQNVLTTCALVFNAGAFEEALWGKSNNRQGLSHLLEHLIFRFDPFKKKQSSKFWTRRSKIHSGSIYEWFSIHLGTINASTSRNSITFWFSIHKNYFYEAIELILSAIFASKLFATTEIVKNEIEVIEDELKQTKFNLEANIMAILIDHFKSHYRNTILANSTICGGIKLLGCYTDKDSEEILSLAEQYHSEILKNSQIKIVLFGPEIPEYYFSMIKTIENELCINEINDTTFRSVKSRIQKTHTTIPYVNTSLILVKKPLNFVRFIHYMKSSDVKPIILLAANFLNFALQSKQAYKLLKPLYMSGIMSQVNFVIGYGGFEFKMFDIDVTFPSIDVAASLLRNHESKFNSIISNLHAVILEFTRTVISQLRCNKEQDALYCSYKALKLASYHFVANNTQLYTIQLAENMLEYASITDNDNNNLKYSLFNGCYFATANSMAKALDYMLVNVLNTSSNTIVLGVNNESLYKSFCKTYHCESKSEQIFSLQYADRPFNNPDKLMYMKSLSFSNYDQQSLQAPGLYFDISENTEKKLLDTQDIVINRLIQPEDSAYKAPRNKLTTQNSCTLSSLSSQSDNIFINSNNSSNSLSDVSTSSSKRYSKDGSDFFTFPQLFEPENVNKITAVKAQKTIKTPVINLITIDQQEENNTNIFNDYTADITQLPVTPETISADNKEAEDITLSKASMSLREGASIISNLAQTMIRYGSIPQFLLPTRSDLWLRFVNDDQPDENGACKKEYKVDVESSNYSFEVVEFRCSENTLPQSLIRLVIRFMLPQINNDSMIGVYDKYMTMFFCSEFIELNIHRFLSNDLGIIDISGKCITLKNFNLHCIDLIINLNSPSGSISNDFFAAVINAINNLTLDNILGIATDCLKTIDSLILSMNYDPCKKLEVDLAAIMNYRNVSLDSLYKYINYLINNNCIDKHLYLNSLNKSSQTIIHQLLENSKLILTVGGNVSRSEADNMCSLIKSMIKNNLTISEQQALPLPCEACHLTPNNSIKQLLAETYSIRIPYIVDAKSHIRKFFTDLWHTKIRDTEEIIFQQASSNCSRFFEISRQRVSEILVDNNVPEATIESLTRFDSLIGITYRTTVLQTSTVRFSIDCTSVNKQILDLIVNLLDPELLLFMRDHNCRAYYVNVQSMYVENRLFLMLTVNLNSAKYIIDIIESLLDFISIDRYSSRIPANFKYILNCSWYSTDAFNKLRDSSIIMKQAYDSNTEIKALDQKLKENLIDNADHKSSVLESLTRREFVKIAKRLLIKNSAIIQVSSQFICEQLKNDLLRRILPRTRLFNVKRLLIECSLHE